MSLPILTTPHLTLVPFAEEDIDALHAIWIDPEVRRFLWDDIAISRDRAAEVVLEAISGIGHWTVRTSPKRPIAGECGFRPYDAGIELFYSLARTHWGQGLAFEGSQAALAYVWSSTSFGRVYARIDAPNEASIRLVRRLGFAYVSSAGGLETYALDRQVG